MEKGNSRLHAMTAFALSEVYKKANNLKLMEHYLLVAAISDITSATKENLALQDIALFIYKHKTRSLKKAQEYINLSLEDAYAYNNRLRRIEISSFFCFSSLFFLRMNRLLIPTPSRSRIMTNRAMLSNLLVVLMSSV